MDYDDRPEPAKRLTQAREARGFRFAKDATTFFGWKYETYSQHEKGTRGLARVAAKYAAAYRISEAWLLTGEGRGPEGLVDPSIPPHILRKIEILPQEEIDDLMDNLEGLTDRKIQKLSDRQS